MSNDEAAPVTKFSKSLEAVIARGEDLLYACVSLLLVAGALVALADAGYSLATEATDGVRKALEQALDSLLIVFILIELLSAVRATIVERRLVAEPFLLVGIIASIKEIVVTGVFASGEAKEGETMLRIGVLAGVALTLSVASLLLRRKEREPKE